jgi:hypothetical protein
MDDTGLKSPLHDDASVCLAGTGCAGSKVWKFTALDSLLSSLMSAFCKIEKRYPVGAS